MTGATDLEVRGPFILQPKAYVRYAMWIDRKTRCQGSPSTDLVGPLPCSLLSPGDTFEPGWAPPIAPYQSADAMDALFAFWSITGGADGPIIADSNIAPTVKVGTSDIFAVAWYVRGNFPLILGGVSIDGHLPPRPSDKDRYPPEIYVDAFDINKGTFVNEHFVKVVPNEVIPNQPTTVTDRANALGNVPSDVDRTITANNQLPIEQGHFVNWKIIFRAEPPSIPFISGEVLSVQAGTYAVAFAFYKETFTLTKEAVRRGHAFH